MANRLRQETSRDAKAQARKELLEQELDRYVQVLKKEENPDKVIVFGSLATGHVHEWSDIDLVVVKETKLPFLKRTRELRKVISPSSMIFIYQPDTLILYLVGCQMGQPVKQKQMRLSCLCATSFKKSTTTCLPNHD